MNAKRRTLAVLAAVIAVLGLALWALNRSTAAEEAASSAAADGTIPLCSFSTADLSRITYTYNGQTLTLDDVDGSWTLAEDSDYHLDESACNTMVTALSSLNAKRQLDAQAGEDYGFDAPELTVTVTAAGQTTTLTFGSSNTVTGDRYVQKDGDIALYTVDASRMACFACDKAGLFGSFSPAGFAVSDVEQSIKDLGYSTYSMQSMRDELNKQTRQIELMLGGLGAISLLVAAIGITNTMIMSISERTKEIGIMKALGCYVRDIRAMFLMEAGSIGLLGGILGLIFSFIISVIINLFSFGAFGGGGVTWELIKQALIGGEGVVRTSVIKPELVIFALVFSVLVGLVSGYQPANKAVKISALEAIRNE